MPLIQTATSHPEEITDGRGRARARAERGMICEATSPRGGTYRVIVLGLVEHPKGPRAGWPRLCVVGETAVTAWMADPATVTPIAQASPEDMHAARLRAVPGKTMTRLGLAVPCG